MGGLVGGPAHHDTEELAEAIGRTLGHRLAPRPDHRPPGGGTGASYCWPLADPSRGERLFVKLLRDAEYALLDCEAEGLRAIAATATLRVPQVRGAGTFRGTAWLALEWLELSPAGAETDEELGASLACLHRTRSDRFGWRRDNFIGRTVQHNGWLQDGVEFLRERRLRPQLQLAARNGHGGRLQRRGAELLERLDSFFVAYTPVPSLLHGDLWSGNRAVTRHGEPIAYDPAVHYGDREADIAMATLFGGFSPRFLSGYEAEWPLESGWERRADLHRLYHVLNHLNLFGGGYEAQAERLLDRLLGDSRG